MNESEPIVPGAPWPAPAKLNLFLHVVGRRNDGYHLLQTVFQFLDYSDELEFNVREDGQFTLSRNYGGIDPAQDLILRAARSLQQAAGQDRGADIRVHKRLPMGGGLGGGSSNAATTLVALNALWQAGFALPALADIGLELGADVPVFIHGQAAWAEGVGERLAPVDPPCPWYLVASPGFGVATAKIFNAPDLTRDTPAITIRDFLEGRGRNDCEPVVRGIYPQIGNLLDWLCQHAPSRLTGTGGCVFASFDTRENAARVLEVLPAPWNGFVARGLNRSPLLDRLHEEQTKLKVKSEK